MTRRDLFRRLAGAAAAIGIPGAVKAADVIQAPADPRKAVAVITCARLLSIEERDRMRVAWVNGMKGTGFEHVRAIVLDRDTTLKVERL